MIERAMELDPNDPVAAQVGATFALDQADVAKAIPLAQAALERSLKYDYYAVESLASARNGLTNIGSAYLNLGLTDWANYYAQLSFTPYLANSHALLSTVYSPRGIRALNSSLNLSLSLEPTAISAPNRYFQFIRQPGNYFTVGGSIGDQDDSTNWSGAVTAQGFARLPTPVAYRVDYNKSDDEGIRINSGAESESINISVGTHLPGRQHHLNLNVFANRSEAGDPGDISENDPDDVNESSSISAALTYQLRVAFDNRILTRIGFSNIRTEFRNPSAFGNNLSDRLLSLLVNFGEEQTRAAVNAGLIDLNPLIGPPCTALEPCIGLEPAFTGFGPSILDPFPDVIDDFSISGSTVMSKGEVDTPYIQFRHMLNVYDIDLTYGLEVMPQQSKSSTVFNDFDVLGIGELFFDLVTSSLFVSVTGRQLALQTDTDPLSAYAYTQGRWKMTDEIWIDAGLFLRHYDDDFSEAETQLDPRFGIGWRVSKQHWLRAAYQRELVLPVPPPGCDGTGRDYGICNTSNAGFERFTN